MKLVAVSFSRETENFINWVEFDYFCCMLLGSA